MAVGDGTPGATTNSGGPARNSLAGHQLRGISRGSSSIRRVGDGTPGTTANSDGPARYSFAGHHLRSLFKPTHA
ncbi:hypothetical protein AVEN_93491-1 [Araneus ventricosus]|uniref:Uncharacterized protein n=1 Tax=Araneus ventricosus TaxID=182803 RepID=A0A4Y2AR90_ARAVE|nr:hypothetical protein AVEN_93491-1 [Araneus ventricosus]